MVLPAECHCLMTSHPPGAMQEPHWTHGESRAFQTKLTLTSGRGKGPLGRGDHIAPTPTGAKAASYNACCPYSFASILVPALYYIIGNSPILLAEPLSHPPPLYPSNACLFISPFHPPALACCRANLASTSEDIPSYWTQFYSQLMQGGTERSAYHLIATLHEGAAGCDA